MSQLFFKTTTTAYVYDGATVTQVTDGDYPATTIRGCAYLDGVFYVATADGTIYGSDLENGLLWNALNFIQAIITPENAVFLAKHDSYVVIFKKFNTEFFFDAANPPPGSALGSVPNLAFKIGCASDASVKEISGTIVWMGQMKDGMGRGIYRLNQAAPEKISDASIEKILDADSLSSVSSWVCKVGSHTLYGLNLSSVTLVYDFESGLWSYFTYLATSGSTKTITAITAEGVVTSTAHGFSDGDILNIAGTNSDFNGFAVATNVSTNAYTIQQPGTAFSGSGTAQKYTEGIFPVVASTASGGVQYMQAATSGALYTLSESVYVDPIGAIAAHIRTSKWDGGTSDWKRISSTELVGDKVDSYAVIRKTDDDYVTYSGYRPLSLNATRAWIYGCGRTSRRAFEVLHVENTAFRPEALEIELER